MATRFWSLLLLQLPLSLRLVAATCYFPNGDTTSDHTACTSSSGTSICCSEGFQCLSNGLCADSRYENFERVLRGACTDKSWGSGCGSICKTDWPDRDEAVHYCGSGKWCCDGNDCCDEGKGILDLGEPSVGTFSGGGNNGGGGGDTSKEQEPAQSTQAPAPTSEKQQEQKPSSTVQEQISSSAVAEVHLTTSKDSSLSKPTDSSKVENKNNAKSSDSTKSDNSDTASPTTTSNSSEDSSISAQPATVTVVNSETVLIPTVATSPAPTPTFEGSAIYKGSKNTIAMGIGIGIGFAALLLVAVFGGWFWMKRRKRKGQGEQGVIHRSVDSSNPFERREYVIELEGSGVPELAGGNRGMEPKEMGGGEKSVELEALELKQYGKEKEVKTWPL